MKNKILHGYNLLSRFEQVLLAGVFLISLILIPSLLLFAYAGNPFIQFIYEHRTLPFFYRFFQNPYPLEHYFALKKEFAFHLFTLWLLLAAIAISILMNLYRFFFSGKKMCLMWIIILCCTITTIIFLYNTELKVASVHTFFYAGPAYQILNGHIPPLDPLFGGETLQYLWGHPWAAACISRILNTTPFGSFEIINTLSLAGCLWLLYKISNLLIDDPKINIFSCLFPIYCGSFLNAPTLLKLKDAIPFYGGESRIFPLLLKFHCYNGIPLGLVFFLMMVYGTMKFFDRKTVIDGILIFWGTIGTLFFYAAFGPGILAWLGFMGLLWLTKYKDSDFMAFGRTLLVLILLIAAAFWAALPYLRQISSSGGYVNIEYFNAKFILCNLFSFLLPTSLMILIIFLNRKYLIENLDHRKLLLAGCLFLSNMVCYLFFHFPSGVEYKYLLLALMPFGIVGGIALARIKHYSRWLALGVFLILFLPSFQLCRYQFESSPRNIFDTRYSASFCVNGTVLKSRDSEENAMYYWIMQNTSMDTYFLDKETKIPVYAQRSLWVGFDTGKNLYGYDMSVPRMKMLHGYDDREYSQRQEVVQNIFGTQRSLTEQEVAAYITQERLLVIVRDNNCRISPNRYGLCEVFTSETGRFRILAMAPTKSSEF